VFLTKRGIAEKHAPVESECVPRVDGNCFRKLASCLYDSDSASLSASGF